MKRKVMLILTVFLLLLSMGCARTPAEGSTGEETAALIPSTDGSTQQTEPQTSAPQDPTQNGDAPQDTQKPVTPPDTTVETENTGCRHDYQQTYTKAATCTAAGSKKFTCKKCGAVTREQIPIKDHSYRAATCLTPKTCTACSHTEGAALGHSYGEDHLCIHCQAKDPNANSESEPVDFLATIRSDEGDPISGVTVTVYTAASGSAPAGSAVTDKNGKATVSLSAGSSQYTVKLSDIPEGYRGQESYTYSVALVNINLKSLPVRTDPNDHSRARYAEGDKMMEFTVTDVDGKTYKLSELLQERKLVIIDFWYVSCNPCKKEFPYFEKALQTYGDDIALLAIDPFYSSEEIRKLRDEMELTFPLLQDLLGMSDGFRVESYPTTVFIDSTGTIRKIHRSAYTSEEAFLRAVEAYL